MSGFSRLTRRLRPVFVGVVALGLGVTAGCVGPSGTTTEMGSGPGEQPARAGQQGNPAAEPTQQGDTSPRKVVEAGGTTPKPSPGSDTGSDSGSDSGGKQAADPSPSATTTISLPALEQPAQKFPQPELPEPPAKDADELTQIAYQLKVRVWNAAGAVDEDTETDCEVDEDDLIDEGTHEFECEVEMSGVAVKFNVKARVTETKLYLSSTTNYLPVSEKKVEHESTRQAFKPARVACDVVGMEALRVGERDGFICWVTDVDNHQRQYEGEMLPNGQLAIRRSTPTVEEQTKQESAKEESASPDGSSSSKQSDQSE